MKYLIVNADDYGYTTAVSKGIIEAHRQGIVTSTSVMVNYVSSEDVSLLRNYPTLSKGLHVILPKDKANIEKEFERQFHVFEKLFGVKPDHVDYHKFLPEIKDNIFMLFESYSKKYAIPFRGIDHINFIQSFFGLHIDGSGTLDLDILSVDGLIAILDRELKDGFNELMCHVGYNSEELERKSSYNSPREKELAVMKSLAVREYVNKNNIKLINFSQLRSM